MRIGIDIDDTITNSSDIFIEFAKEYNKKYNMNFNINTNTLDFSKAFGWNELNANYFLKKNLKKILENVNAKKYSVEIINQLKEEKNEIYFITARRNSEVKNMFELTKKWLDFNNYKYNKLIIECIDKANACKEYKIDVFIDDSYNNCKLVQIINNIPVIVFKTRYNSNVEDNSIIMVDNWLEIYEILKKGVIKNEK